MLEHRLPSLVELLEEAVKGQLPHANVSAHPVNGERQVPEHANSFLANGVQLLHDARVDVHDGRRVAARFVALLAALAAAAPRVAGCAGAAAVGHVAAVGVHVNALDHRAAKAAQAGPVLLHGDGLHVFVANPLVAPRQLLLHVGGELLQPHAQLRHEQLHLLQRRDAATVGARQRAADAAPRAGNAVAAGVGERVAAAVVHEAEVQLGRVDALVPQQHRLVGDLGHVRLAVVDGADLLDVVVPRPV